MSLIMSVIGEIKTAAKTARADKAAEAITNRACDSIQKTVEFYEFASRQFRRGAVLVGILAVEEGARIEFGGDNLVLASIAGGLGGLAIMYERRAVIYNPEELEVQTDNEAAGRPVQVIISSTA